MKNKVPKYREPSEIPLNPPFSKGENIILDSLELEELSSL
jgi:hypothetical protein